MIRFLDVVSFLLNCGYVLVFFWILLTFVPLRKNWVMRILALLSCNVLADVIIYSNDLANLLGALLGFGAYIALFHRGKWIEKATAVLFFYPALIGINYLMTDVGSRYFFGVTQAPDGMTQGWTREELLISTGIHTLSVFLRLLFWILAWLFLKKYLHQITEKLTTKMWLLLDVLMLSPFVAIFTIIYFMPENPWIVYPICGASVFSSFGCVYLAAYICNSLETEYHAKELETKQAYFKERMEDEERVRSIYHDLKNHLLILQAQAGNGREVWNSIQDLKSQMEEYENYYHTGNEFLDIIIRDKARAAKERGIDFSAVLSLSGTEFLEMLDISAIFGNALDNAIEASLNLPEEQRLITVKGNRIRDMIVISVENNAKDAVFSGATTKKDSFLHGFGIANMKTAVSKYGGECSTKMEDGVFSLKILIPVP